MATFKVGQRVRLVRHLYGPDSMRSLIGAEGVIASPLKLNDWPDEQRSIHDVRIGQRIVCCLPDELEPIQYDGNTPVEWSQCLWAPESEKVTA